MDDDIKHCSSFHPTSIQFISALFSSEKPGASSSSAAATSTRNKAPTVASKFSVSLSQLIAAMSKCEESQLDSYINCVLKGVFHCYSFL